MLLSDLHPMMRVLAPGLPEPLLNVVLVDTAREFCRQTRVWRYELESGDLSKEGSVIILAPPEDSEIIKLFSVEYGDVGPLLPATRAQLSRADREWRDAEGDPTHYVFTSPDTLALYPQPTTLSMSDVTVSVALMPTVGVTELADHFAVPYSEVIRNGALARLFLIPGKPWSNPALGAAYGAAFATSLADIGEDGTDSNLPNVPRRVRYGGY